MAVFTLVLREHRRGSPFCDR